MESIRDKNLNGGRVKIKEGGMQEGELFIGPADKNTQSCCVFSLKPTLKQNKSERKEDGSRKR